MPEPGQLVESWTRGGERKMAEVVNLITLEPGAKVATSAGATVEVVDNPKDGIWVFAKYLTCPDDPSLEGTEDMFFAQDLVEVLS